MVATLDMVQVGGWSGVGIPYSMLPWVTASWEPLISISPMKENGVWSKNSISWLGKWRHTTHVCKYVHCGELIQHHTVHKPWQLNRNAHLVCIPQSLVESKCLRLFLTQTGLCKGWVAPLPPLAQQGWGTQTPNSQTVAQSGPFHPTRSSVNSCPNGLPKHTNSVAFWCSFIFEGF